MKNLKRAVVVGGLAMSMFGTLASANTTYTVSRTVGGGSVSGYIETDGSFGTLSSANLVDWALTLTSPNLAGGSPATIRMTNPGGGGFGISGTSVSATATDLYYNFAANSDYFILYSLNDASTANNWWCLIGGSWTCVGESTPAETIGFGASFSYAETVTHFGMQSIASVTAVPEPETYAMLLAGLGLLGFAARRRKQKLAAA